MFPVLALLLCGMVMATEPHFDLPKKDVKEQCAEMQRVSNECGYDKQVSDNLYSCGNIYIKLLEIGDPFFEPLGTVIMVLDTEQNPIGIQVDYENSIIFGDYKNNFTILPQSDTMVTSQEDMLTYKKYHKKIVKSKVQIKINNCYVTQLIEK